MSFINRLLDRIQRLTLTLVSKQWLVFALGTVLLTKKFINAEIWFMLAGVVIGANIFQKVKGIQPEVAK